MDDWSLELSLRATDLLGQVETGMTTLQDRPAKSFVCVVVIGSAARNLLLLALERPF
jgi:hypothetical protein